MWAKPKVSVFKNGQLETLFVLRKIFCFWKKKRFSPLNDNFCLFFEKIFFKFFSNCFFLCTLFLLFGHLFLGDFFLKKQGQQHYFFFKVSEKQKKVSLKKKFEKKWKIFFLKNKYFSQKIRVSKLSVFENGHFWLCPHIRLTSGTSPTVLEMFYNLLLGNHYYIIRI